MSDYTVIADVSETLLRLLRDRLAGLVATDHVTLASPAEIELDTSPWLGLFLYQVAENPHLKTQEPVRVDALTLQHPPVTLDLSYLVVPFAQTRENEHQILGRVVQVLGSDAVLQGPRLLGSLARTEEVLRVTLHPLSLEELQRLWTVFTGKPYKLSLSYQVSPVRVDRVLPAVGVQPVVERVLRVGADHGRG
jgi:hypothetical protein